MLIAAKSYKKKKKCVFKWAINNKIDIFLKTPIHSLLILNISKTNINEILALPPNLEILNCSNNNLTTLPKIPFSLKELNINNNKFTYLNVSYTNIVKVMCNSNLLVNILKLPNTIEELWCCNNKLEHMPILPMNLNILICNNNNLTYLPILTGKLTKFACCYNKLHNIPKLPHSLVSLYCDNNNLFILPILPISLKSISLYNNTNIIYTNLYGYDDSSNKISYINYINIILHKFKFIFYMIKFKLQFHRWLWKSREQKIKLEMHPDNILNLCYDEIYGNY